MSDDVDLYDDLPDLNFQESISKIDEERKLFKTQLDEKEADLLKTKERIAHLEKENKILEKNISSLYQTAVNEIKRKDQLIEELRREKDILIFRRKDRQNPNKPTAEALDSSLPAKHLITSVKSTNSTLSPPLEKKSLVPSCKVESSPDISCDYKRFVECSSSSLVSEPVQPENRDSHSRVNDVSDCISQVNNKISEINSSEKSCENNSSEISYTLPDKLSSDSSHTSSNVTHGSTSKEIVSTSKERVSTKIAKQPYSEERRGRQNYDFSDKYYPRNGERSSYYNYRSPKLPIERSRHDRSWDRNSDRKYSKGSYKEINFQMHKYRMGTCDEFRRKHPFHSRRSPSPPQHSRRYSDRRRSTSKARTLSDNMRMATQLKSKYSKAMRERSVSRTPMKHQKLYQQKIELKSSCKPVELQNTVFPDVNLEDRFVTEGHEYEKKLSSKEQSTEKFVNTDKCNFIQSKENNSESSDKSCQKGKTEKEVERNEISEEKQCSLIPMKTDITEHSSSAQSKRWSSEVYRNESFETEREVNLTNNKDNDCEKLPSQQLRTPPSKNLIPLKISPSFEDPAIVKEKNFSFCVFNEQCDFKRPKRRRSVKLLVSKASDLASESCEKDESVFNVDNCESGIAMGQNMDLCPQSSKDILEKSAFDEKRSPKKRKLDSICDELKANLEKKCVMSRVELISDGSANILSNVNEQISLFSTSVKEDEQSKTVNKISNCSTVNSNTVNSIEIPKRIVISKRRRKVCNLQDNVVQVISQVKSRLS
ncbi:hypothetical protein R5R35_002192 [Gryllus longicercus]|uniref:Uncharacterized protein n=1 Tax=Gryllus longicercus TaxID=2509291 RepID=A0AAN9VXG6_9ORTH